MAEIFQHENSASGNFTTFLMSAFGDTKRSYLDLGTRKDPMKEKNDTSFKSFILLNVFSIALLFYNLQRFYHFVDKTSVYTIQSCHTTNKVILLM